MKRTGRLIATYFLLTLAAIYAVFPVLWGVLTSFKVKEDVFSTELHILPTHWTLDNYIYVLTNHDYVFLTWFKNSLLIAALTSMVCLFLASTAGYAFSRFRFPGRRQGLFLFMIVQMFPGIILIIPLYNLMKTLGLLNTHSGLIIAYATSALPFCVWMLKSFFDTVPKSLEEAARMDGLGQWGTFYRIVLPLSLPGLAVTLFFAFVTAWNEFMFALTFLNNEELLTLPVGVQTYVHEYNTDWHLMAAAGVMITIPAMLVFLKLQKMIISGMMAGATKS